MEHPVDILPLYLQENEEQSFDSDTQDSPHKTSRSKHLILDSDNDNESVGESDAKSSDNTLVWSGE